jgi:hypothetical protein
MFLVYFAGELFSSKHLVGNAALADAIAKASNMNFVCTLPQAVEEQDLSAHDIRDQDFVTWLYLILTARNWIPVLWQNFCLQSSQIFLPSFCELISAVAVIRETILGIS